MLGALIDRNGVPPMWRRPPGFATLTRLILEQQVSLASAAAAFRRLEEAVGTVVPELFLALDDDRLRAIGFSRQKTGYVRGLAEGLVDGSIDLAAVGELDDGEATAALTAIRGVGDWTAACYLLFALRRPDAWPTGDRALHVAMSDALGLGDVPGSDEAADRAEAWRPHRAVAARVLWHAYLRERGFAD